MSLLEFESLFREDVNSIRARVDADVNATIDPTDTAFTDTTEGGIYYDVSQPLIIEIARLYDAIATEYPAAIFPLFAFGTWLNYWGQILGVDRKDSAPALGVVRFTGTVGTLIAPGTMVATLQTDPVVEPAHFQVTAVGGGVIPIGGFIDLPVAATEVGSIGNVASGTVTVLETPNSGITAITNVAAIAGGVEVETDQSYSERIVLEFSSPPGAGNQADYVKWARAYPGVGHATVQPLWAGAGTVRVIITDDANNPLSSPVVAGLQADLDPVAQQGAGRAPIGALVTVATPTLVTISVSATVAFDAGYSLDGASGTVALRAAIVSAIRNYIDSLAPGDAVVYRHVEARFFAVPGVHDVSSLLVNGAGVNITLTGLQVADQGTVTLT